MPRHLLHIGYHKTGTNWFQRALYPNVTSHRYVPRRAVDAAFLLDAAGRFDANHALETLSESAADTPLILCSEDLSGNLHNGGMRGFQARAVAERLHAALPGANVLITIRAQPAMIGSAYKQYVREGGTHGPKRYLYPQQYLSREGFAPHKAPLFCFEHFDYRPLIEHYRALFGPERVHVLPYELFRRAGQRVIHDLAGALELTVNWSAVSFATYNRAYGAGTLRLARFLNHFTQRDVLDKRCWVPVPGWYKLRRGLLKRINALPGMGRPIDADRLLGDAILRDIHGRYAASNRQLAALLDLPLADLGYPCEVANSRLHAI